MKKPIEDRINRLEREMPRPRCSHPGILLHPTDEELEEAERQLAACPRCSTSKSSRPHMVVMIFEDSPKKSLEPKETLEPNTVVIGSA